MSNPSAPAPRWTVRQLSLAARLTLAAFLISVGIGYFSALVNLHFQSATPGNPLPTDDDVITQYSGRNKISPFERLLIQHDSLPFNGQGSMRSAFTSRVGGMARLRKDKASDLGVDLKDPAQLKKVNEAVAQDLDGERRTLIAWTRVADAQQRQKTYEDNRFALEGDLATLAVTPKFVEEDQGARVAKVKSIIEVRCARCHSSSVGGPGAQFPLDTIEDISLYLVPEEGRSGMSLPKLALTTHVHLLAFSMLYMLTGLILACTGWPAILRVPLAPLPLIAQVIDIAFWWLARMEEPYGSGFARLIPVSGAVVGASVALQIILSLFALFGWSGRFFLVLLMVAAGFGGYVAKEKVIDPHLASEKEVITSSSK